MNRREVKIPGADVPEVKEEGFWGVLRDAFTHRVAAVRAGPKGSGLFIDGNGPGGNMPYAGAETKYFRLDEQTYEAYLRNTLENPPTAEEIRKAVKLAQGGR